MAARKKNYHDPKTREKIKIQALLDRLQRFALGEQDKFGNEIKMSVGQVNAALSLIRKVLPDLSASDINLTAPPVESKAEAREKLVGTLGEEIARQVAPEFFTEDLSENRILN